VENSRHQYNQRNQSVPSALQRDDQIARGEESCLPASDYTDDAGESVSANGSQTLSIPPPFGGCSLQFPSASEDVLSQRENIQDDRNVGVINRNHRNQSMSATLQGREHVEQSSANSDYGDCADYANESVSVYWSQTHEPHASLAGASLQLPAAAEDLLSQREDVQGTQDYRADGVINRNQRNQSMLATTQASDHVGHSSPKCTDYVDYPRDAQRDGRAFLC
jgi:hypothetical protein